MEIIAPNGKTVYRDDNTKPIIVRKPVLWDVDAPHLYTARITYGEQTIVKQFGFRSFEFREHGPFFLNGHRLLLQGTHRHEDHAGVGAAMTDEQILQEMLQIKQMGANFIRLGHYQQSERVLQLCDSLGLLVWEEIPWCRGGVGGDRYQAQAHRMLTNMINQHRHHPSIILWGLGNENDWPGDFQSAPQPTQGEASVLDSAAVRRLMASLNALAHQLDPTRKTVIRRCDFCADIVDVYSPSIWAGWYSRRFTDYREMEEAAMAKYPYFFHAEWGADSHAGRHAKSGFDIEAGDRNGDWSESVTNADAYVATLVTAIDAMKPEDRQRLTLIGHSLGGRIVAKTVAELQRKNIKIQNAVMLAAAIPFDDADAELALQSKTMPVISIYNPNDKMLKYAYRIAGGENSTALGAHSTGKPNEFRVSWNTIEDTHIPTTDINWDFVKSVFNHTAIFYLQQLKKITESIQ